jgi:3-hydroxybutyryl-CoA dehydrogenase
LSEVVVVGAGTMGHGIAQVAAAAGFTVTLVDVTPERVAAGLDRIAANLRERVERGRLEQVACTEALERLSGSTSISPAATGAGLAIEAVPERLELKREVFAQLQESAPADALLASNTSSLSITELQRGLRAPERVLGLHFFNPVPVNPLVEVVRGAATSPPTVTRALELVARLGKQAVVVKDSPGFATSRLGVLLGLEAMRMVEEGVASAADIDRVMELGYRHPLGPLRLSDLIGLDVRLDIARELHQKLGGEQFRPPAILERLVAQGRLGKKTGAGFYEWAQE